MLLQLADYYPLLFLAPFLALELFWRARHYDAPRGWRLRALVVSLMVYGVSLGAGMLWGMVLPQASLIDGAALGTWGGAACGILLYELAHYWYHRMAHQWDWLWRLGHQMHHSAESVDAFGAYYLHPADAALFTTTRTSVRRAGSAISSSGRRATGCTTAAASITKRRL